MIKDANLICISQESEMYDFIDKCQDLYCGFRKKQKLLKYIKTLPHNRAGKVYQFNFYHNLFVDKLPNKIIQTVTKTLYTGCGIIIIANLFQPIIYASEVNKNE